MLWPWSEARAVICSSRGSRREAAGRQRIADAVAAVAAPRAHARARGVFVAAVTNWPTERAGGTAHVSQRRARAGDLADLRQDGAVRGGSPRGEPRRGKAFRVAPRRHLS